MGINQEKWPERDSVVLEKGDRKAFCRCWQSKKFPLCDGSHKAWNEQNNDKIGPMIVECCSKD